MPRNFTSPTGRLVQGDAFEAQTTDQQGKPRVVQSGPRIGQPAPQWFVAVAFAKNDPAWPPFKAILDAEAAGAWPSLFPQGAAGPCVLPSFSNKVIDGDGFDTTGKHNATKEGFAGHWIVRFTSGYAPKVYKPGAPGTWLEITTPAEVKRGYYVRIAGTTATNGNATKPGVHVNLGLVELVGQGPEIISGPSAADAFAQPPALPPGASALPPSATPLPGGAPPMPPGVPVAPAPVAPAPPPVAPAPPYAGFLLIPTATMPAGHTVDSLKALGWTEDQIVVQGYATRPQVPAAPAAPPLAPAAPMPMNPPAPPAIPPAPPSGPVMTAKAGGATYEAMKALNWTDAQLREHGYMI